MQLLAVRLCTRLPRIRLTFLRPSLPFIGICACDDRHLTWLNAWLTRLQKTITWRTLWIAVFFWKVCPGSTWLVKSNKNGDRRRFMWNTCCKSLLFLAMNEDNQGVARWSDASDLSSFNKTVSERASKAIAADYDHIRGHFGGAELVSWRVFPGRSGCR